MLDLHCNPQIIKQHPSFTTNVYPVCKLCPVLDEAAVSTIRTSLQEETVAEDGVKGFCLMKTRVCSKDRGSFADEIVSSSFSVVLVQGSGGSQCVDAAGDASCLMERWYITSMNLIAQRLKGGAWEVRSTTTPMGPGFDISTDLKLASKPVALRDC